MSSKQRARAYARRALRTLLDTRRAVDDEPTPHNVAMLARAAGRVEACVALDGTLPEVYKRAAWNNMQVALDMSANLRRD